MRSRECLLRKQNPGVQDVYVACTIPGILAVPTWALFYFIGVSLVRHVDVSMMELHAERAFWVLLA